MVSEPSFENTRSLKIQTDTMGSKDAGIEMSTSNKEGEERTEEVGSIFKLKIHECIKTTKDKGKEGMTPEDEVSLKQRTSTEENYSTSTEKSINLAPSDFGISEESSTTKQVFPMKPTKHVNEIRSSTEISLIDKLHAMRISFNNLTEENVRLKATNVMLSEINVVLETQVFEFKETCVKCLNDENELDTVLKRKVGLKEQLKKTKSTRSKIIKEEESDADEKEDLDDVTKIDYNRSYPSEESTSKRPCIRCGRVNHLYTSCKFARTRSVQLPLVDMPVMHHTFANNA